MRHYSVVYKRCDKSHDVYPAHYRDDGQKFILYSVPAKTAVNTRLYHVVDYPLNEYRRAYRRDGVESDTYKYDDKLKLIVFEHIAHKSCKYAHYAFAVFSFSCHLPSPPHRRCSYFGNNIPLDISHFAQATARAYPRRQYCRCPLLLFCRRPAPKRLSARL